MVKVKFYSGLKNLVEGHVPIKRTPMSTVLPYHFENKYSNERGIFKIAIQTFKVLN